MFFKKYYNLITFDFGCPLLSIDRLSTIIEPVYADRNFIKLDLKFNTGEDVYIETLARGELQDLVSGISNKSDSDLYNSISNISEKDMFGLMRVKMEKGKLGN